MYPRLVAMLVALTSIVGCTQKNTSLKSPEADPIVARMTSLLKGESTLSDNEKEIMSALSGTQPWDKIIAVLSREYLLIGKSNRNPVTVVDVKSLGDSQVVGESFSRSLRDAGDSPIGVYFRDHNGKFVFVAGIVRDQKATIITIHFMMGE